MILSRALSRPLATIENPAVPLTSTALLERLDVRPTDAGVRVNQTTAVGLPAVWRSVSLVAGGAGSLPLGTYSKKGDVRVPVATGNAAALIKKPHPDMTPFEWQELLYAHMLLWGNSYHHKLRDRGGKLAELWPIHPGSVTPGRASDGKKVYQVDGMDPDQGFTDKEILHVPGLGFDGIAGLSPIALCRQGLGLSLAAERFGATFFGSGSLAAGVLKTDRRLTTPQADAIKARWKAKNSGIDNAHDVIVLDSGASFQQLTIPPEDAQFIESRRFQIAEIARMFGVPAHMLMETDASTSWGSGIEQMSIGFVMYTLRPWLTRVEQRLTQMLQPDEVYAHYNIEGLLRADSAARGEFYTKMWDRGVFSTDDIRALEDLPPVDGGDVRYRPLNMGVLGQSDTPDAPGESAPTTAADEARAIAEISQKIYLAVGVMISADEARAILNRAGAGLEPIYEGDTANAA